MSVCVSYTTGGGMTSKSHFHPEDGFRFVVNQFFRLYLLPPV